MDLFELVILLIFFLAPAIGRLFGKKESPPPAPGPQETARREEGDPLSEALRQIREALGEPEPERTAEPDSARRDQPGREPEPGFYEVSQVEPTAPPPVVSAPPARVRKPSTKPSRSQPIRTKPPKSVEPRPVDLTTPLAVQKPRSSSPSPAALTRLLRDPQRAREALILHEVLGPPRSRRRGR